MCTTHVFEIAIAKIFQFFVELFDKFIDTYSEKKNISVGFYIIVLFGINKIEYRLSLDYRDLLQNV